MSSAASASAAAADGLHHDVRHGEKLSYLSGFNNEHSSEALAAALPLGQNNPQKVRPTGRGAHLPTLLARSALVLRLGSPVPQGLAAARPAICIPAGALRSGPVPQRRVS
jgi:hypothetical protein